MSTYDLSTLTGQIEAAFDYRGNVTVTLKDGHTVDGFLFNRELAPKGDAPFVELYLDKNPTPVKYAVAAIASIALTGVDTAAGKSWETWQEKQKHKHDPKTA